MCIVKLEEICLNDNNKSILSNINLEIRKNDLITIIGSSGSGKSTLLKIISSLKNPSSGSLFFENKPYSYYAPTELRKKISYCIQQPYLFGDTVIENLIFPFKLRNIDPDFDIISSHLDSFELSSDLINESCNKLSGGEKQRLALIRSIMFPPKVLLLDEVTSALDGNNTSVVEKNINRLNSQGVTVLWITHDIEQSLRIGKKRLTIKAGYIDNFEVLK